MLRASLGKNAGQLASCSSRTTRFALAASPARAALTAARRPLALAPQRRSYALPSDETTKGVVSARGRALKVLPAQLTSATAGNQRLVFAGQHGQLCG